MSAARRDLADEVLKVVASTSTVPVAPVQKSEALPSTRPTSVPDFDVSALATGSIRYDTAPAIPLDLVVPTRLAADAGKDATPAAAAVFAQANGSVTLATIAWRAGLSLTDAIGGFLELLGSGVIDVDTTEGAPVASGIYRTRNDE